MPDRYETFTALITKINRNIKKIKNLEMAEYNLRSPHISCLYYLYLSGDLTATELAEKCEEDKATISRSLAYLEENGFLTCDSDSTKRYNTPLVLTRKGQNAGKKIADKIEFLFDEIGKGISEQEKIPFYRNLTTISDGLEALSSQTRQKA